MLESEKEWVLQQIADRLAESGINELAMLRHLEKKVRAMFEFTGWEDDCDDAAAEAAILAREALDWVDETRAQLGFVVGKTEGNK